MKKRIAASLALLKPVDDIERERFTTEIEEAIWNIEDKQLSLTAVLTAKQRRELEQYKCALVKADQIFPKLHRYAQMAIASGSGGDGKLRISKTFPTFDHKKQIASINRLLKSKPRPAHRVEADKTVAKRAAKLILDRVGGRCSVDALAAALYGTAGTFRNIKL